MTFHSALLPTPIARRFALGTVRQTADVRHHAVRAAYEQRYLPNEGVWLLSTPEVPFEIIVGGDSSSPSQPRMELLNKVSLDIAALNSSSSGLLG